MTDETMMTIHFNANLRPVVGDRIGMLHWIFDPLAAGFIIAYDLSDNAVLISNFDSDKHPVQSWSEELCKQVLAGAIGKDISPKILSYRPWLLSRNVAKSYRQGNVFLAGDAAHSFPPTGGLGLNSGIADVHNLAFKIAAVLQGQASASLLDTYELERRPVAEVNSRQSVKNGKKIFGLLKTLGTAGLTDMEEARARLFTVIHDSNKQQEIQDGIEDQREHFDNLNLHIGYVYGDRTIPKHASTFKPQFVPGARLPHAWIQPSELKATTEYPPVDLSYVSELSVSDAAVRQYSTLDLCKPDAFTLILPENADHLDEQIKCLQARAKLLRLRIDVYHLAIDFTVSTIPSGESWTEVSGILSGRGILVRPDQHILCTLTAEQTGAGLVQILDEFLGHV